MTAKTASAAPGVVVHGGPDTGRRVIAWECGCAADARGTVGSVHYIFGPDPTRETAEEYARSRTRGHGRRVHVFPLWPSGQERQ